MNLRSRIQWGEFTIQALIKIAGFSVIGFVILIFFFLYPI